MGNKYKTIDLFAGIGGLRRGFEMTGRFENVMSSEMNEYACITYEHNFGVNPENRISDDLFKYSIEQQEYDVLLSGHPRFGRRSTGKHWSVREKNILFNDIVDIIIHSRPKAFLLVSCDTFLREKKGQTAKLFFEKICRDSSIMVL